MTKFKRVFTAMKWKWWDQVYDVKKPHNFINYNKIKTLVFMSTKVVQILVV